MVKNLLPTAGRVIIKRLAQEDKSPGGVIIPDTAQEKPMQGEVLAVGVGELNSQGERVAPSLKVGDRVLVGKWSGTEFHFGGEELLVAKESDVLAVIMSVN